MEGHPVLHVPQPAGRVIRSADPVAAGAESSEEIRQKYSGSISRE